MKLIAALCLLVSMTTAHARLVDVPGQNYNEDTTTGLRWLDTTVTAGLSFDQAATMSGWRHATQLELTTVFSSPFGEAMDVLGGPNFLGGTSSGIMSFIALTGIYAPGSDGLASYVTTANGVLGISFGAPGYRAAVSGPIGNFLVSGNAAAITVSPVPEPETYAMMALGLVALVFVARRRKSHQNSLQAISRHAAPKVQADA